VHLLPSLVLVQDNASGWKVHLRSKPGISGSGTASSGQGTVLVQSTLGEVVFPDGVQRKFENAIIDYVVGGGISLRAAGGQRFKQLVMSLTNGYEPPSTRTILRRIVELFRIGGAPPVVVPSPARRRHLSHAGRLVQPKSEGILHRDGPLGRHVLYGDEESTAYHY
jgi:hypothetical protein